MFSKKSTPPQGGQRRELSASVENNKMTFNSAKDTTAKNKDPQAMEPNEIS